MGIFCFQPVPASPTLYVWIFFLPSAIGVVVENHHHQQLLDMRVVVVMVGCCDGVGDGAGVGASGLNSSPKG